ncbi:MerR family transcriptional regulator [Rhodococcus sp. IEGM 1401]|uniref:MerR family transcriptional regulator n=1 Tax=unclassified Rhodococcus (in: high G+C Gram-positive bacteria) TaxID=192944 RepID=UPI0022B556C5|nr:MULTISPECIES: MerR family transcriptional regulator [unclassified Rhodococcus (in: high G+C Gram-positive bacteria)]MCZ4559913.1 MerR family transcriptional regulator [Rhodococcus sp. IEGM 1401]MDI9920043.1 MerR family transcriptional regulator [Rhodococcus sp. IEGM 1372]MDV8032494.1 MerR family transcriptional regulator [Rhodococcus sp. IEGM 1414]
MSEYTIGEVAKAVGLSVHALRFYERKGLLLGSVERTASGRRRYSQIDIDWLRVCTRLRESRMPLADLERFAVLVRDGAGNEADRLALLSTHRARIDAQIAELEQAREIIAWKTDVYEQRLRTGNIGGVWDPTVSRNQHP